VPPTVASSRPATSPPATTVARPTAARALHRFFAAAVRVDRRLHAAAILINGGVGSTSVHFPQATIDAIEAADPAASAATIPAGMRPDLLRAVVLVQSDLASRWYAFQPIREGLYGPPAYERGRVLACLANGAPAARRFRADLATARTLARSLPPVAVAPRDSRAAAEVAIRLAFIDKADGGCDSCGGYLATDPPQIVWRHIANAFGRPWDGTVGRILFRAGYRAGTGWAVVLNAC
jgi:hypothetical protein